MHVVSIDSTFNVDNMFWDSSTHLMLCDFEYTNFRNEESAEYICEWVHLDKGGPMSTLVDCGMVDPHSEPPGWFYGIILSLNLCG
jgi:hypothetical protein